MAPEVCRRHHPHTRDRGEHATGRRIWAAFALACAVWVGAQVVGAAVTGAPLPNPVATLFAADVTGAGGGTSTVRALAPTPASDLVVRVDLLSRPSAPRAVLLRDAVPVARFSGGSVTVAVAPGDLLEVDATSYPQPLTFEVVEAKGLSEPAPGARVTTRGDIVPLGRVRLAP